MRVLVRRGQDDRLSRTSAHGLYGPLDRACRSAVRSGTGRGAGGPARFVRAPSPGGTVPP
ncbi:hypothetical protein APASM_0784 [Actinosynnema pretiosum subsp. pretiosum]|nr:hypothetical protein APASM_0784 [Actinosynnema pretiosum subsp. pretiosum]